MTPATLLRSFWIAGFEGADHLNSHGVALDMARANGHLDRIDEDYARAAALGIRTVRESVGWRLAETAPGRVDLGRVLAIARAARRHGIQVLWTLMHYGTPPDVDLHDDAMVARFARFAEAVADALAPYADEPPVYTPINEIGFVAWTVSETNLMHPYRGDPEGRGASTLASGYAVKRRLVRAALTAIGHVRRVDPRARFMHVEPLVHVVAPPGRPELEAVAAQVAGYQWQAWDMLVGREAPELGGDPSALDWLGVNHYHSGQWEAGTEERLKWHEHDPRRRPPAELLQDAWRRYRRPVVVAETSHFGAGRAAWLDDMASQVMRAQGGGTPVLGICLYPFVDRPDWDAADHWHESGLFEVRREDGGRRLHRGYARALARWQRALPGAASACSLPPRLVAFIPGRWDAGCGRQQHLLARLARDWRVTVVEPGAPPLEPGAAPRVERVPHGPHLETLRLRVASGSDVDAAALIDAALRDDAADTDADDDRVVWVATPSAWPIASRLAARIVVCDGCDRPPSASDADERSLVAAADLVLAAGPLLHARLARLRRGVGGAEGAVHRVPNGVDAGWWNAAEADEPTDPTVEAARVDRLLGGIGRPRLGFHGVVDRAVDLGLLAAVADARPAWQVLVAGSFDGVDRAALPARPNLHWIGAPAGEALPSEALPHFAAACDVGLLPYAVGDAAGNATSSPNPVQALEWLAVRRPVVSTALPEVAELYGDAVRCAGNDAASFVAACERALRGPPGDLPAAAASWNAVAAAVRRLIQEAQESLVSAPRRSVSSK